MSEDFAPFVPHGATEVEAPPKRRGRPPKVQNGAAPVAAAPKAPRKPATSPSFDMMAALEAVAPLEGKLVGQIAGALHALGEESRTKVMTALNKIFA